MNLRGRGARTIAPLAVVALALAASLRGASAQTAVESLVTLQWVAPPDACPDAAYVYGEIGRLLGGGSDPAADAHVAARARVEPTDAGYRVQLATDVSGMKGQRTLDAQTCKGAANATALILALMVNPARVTVATAGASSTSSTNVPTAASSVAPAAASSATPVASTAPVATTIPTAAPVARGRVAETTTTHGRWSLSEGAVLDLGSFPSSAFGAFVAGALSWGRARFELSFVYLPRRRITVDGGDTGASFRLLGVEPRVGWALVQLPATSVLATLGLDVSRIDATGFGVTKPSSGGAFRVGGALGALASLRLGARLSIRVHVAAIVPLNRPDYGFDGGGGVHREPAVTGRATLGLELDF